MLLARNQQPATSNRASSAASLVTAVAFMIALGAALLSASSVSAEDPVLVDLRVDAPPVVTVGDHVTYTIVLEVDTGTGVAIAAAGLPPEVALVDRPKMTRVPLTDGREQVTISFVLAPFIAGEVLVPPVPVRFTQPGGEAGILDTPGTVIDVTSVLPQAGQVSPRELKPQAEIGAAPPTWPLPVAAALVALLVLLVIVLLLRRRVKKYVVTRAQRRAPVFVGPEDAARARLDAAGAAYAADGQLVPYYTVLGNTTREYLTQRYGFPAFALTTRELETAMLRLGVDRWQIRVASGLLEQCDAVVYARYRPASERADADLTAAYEVVEMSRPQPRPVGEEREVAVS
jgi:hypothetical protein